MLNLYDPDRSETVLHEGRISTWGEFTGDFSTEAQGMATHKGEGLAVLTGATTSPTLISQMKRLLTQWPIRKWYVHEPIRESGASPARPGRSPVRNAFVAYDLSKADVIVSLDSDFLNIGPAAHGLRAAVLGAPERSKAARRRNRMYAIESAPTVSGSHSRSPISGEEQRHIPALTYQLAKACGVTAPEARERRPNG